MLPAQSARAVSTVHQPGQQMRACGAWVEQDLQYIGLSESIRNHLKPFETKHLHSC
jgi:hypothetical protein